MTELSAIYLAVTSKTQESPLSTHFCVWCSYNKEIFIKPIFHEPNTNEDNNDNDHSMIIIFCVD